MESAKNNYAIKAFWEELPWLPWTCHVSHDDWLEVFAVVAKERTSAN